MFICSFFFVLPLSFSCETFARGFYIFVHFLGYGGNGFSNSVIN